MCQLSISQKMLTKESETKLEIQNTAQSSEKKKAFVNKVDFYETHIFKYSRRQGTKAAAMPEQIPEQIKTERSHVLLKLHEKNKTAYLEQFVGKELEVLFEEQVKIGEKTVWSGYSREYIRVLWDTEECLYSHPCPCRR